MIESKDARAAREKAEAASREANVKRYEEKMGVQLPYSPVTVIERKPEPINVSTPVVNVKPSKAVPSVNVNRKAYMMDYMKKWRAKPKMCPHCGKEISGQKEAG